MSKESKLKISMEYNTFLDGDPHETKKTEDIDGIITIGFREKERGVETECGICGEINSRVAAAAVVNLFSDHFENGLKNLLGAVVMEIVKKGEADKVGVGVRDTLNNVEIDIDVNWLLSQLFEQ